MAFCTECGSKLPENAQFCINCGTRQSAFSETEPTKPEETESVSPNNSEAAEQLAPSPAEAEMDEGVKEAADTAELHYYTPPQATGGFVPPYKPGAYSFAPPPQTSPAVPPKKDKTALIVILSIVGLAILAIVLFVIFAPKGASDSLLGYWEAEEIDFGNGRFVDEYLGHDVSGTMGLEISSDGSMSLGSAYNTKIIEGRWERTSSGISATLNGETVYVALSGDDLVLLDGDMAIIFSRSQRDINNPTVPFGSLSGSEEAPLLPDGEHSHEGESANTAVAGSGDVANGMFHVSVVGAEKITDVNDRQGIRIYYEFTNNFDYSVSAWNVLNFEAVQDGKALRSTYTWDDSEAEYYNHDRAIRPGVTILCFAEYSANLSGGSIDFSVFGWDEGKNGGTVTATYSPDALPGRPAAYVIKPIEDPQWTLSLPESGTLDEQFSVSVGDADLITDAYGDSAIRVFYTFKNDSSAPICLTRALYCHSYQDGIELDETYALDETETDAQAYQDIAPGETAACSVVFKLRNSTSPVEAEIEAAQTYDAVGQTYSIA